MVQRTAGGGIGAAIGTTAVTALLVPVLGPFAPLVGGDAPVREQLVESVALAFGSVDGNALLARIDDAKELARTTQAQRRVRVRQA